MKYKSTTKQELLGEITVLKQRIKQLEHSESERKRAEEALRASEENYRRLFESSPAAIYQVDLRTGKFLKANDIFCEHFDCSHEEITSYSPFDLLTDESRQLLSERLNKMFLGKKVSENPEYEVIDKNGKRLWFQLSSKNIYDSEGLMGADVVAHDITKRKRAEGALQRAHDELEHRVAERTEELMWINKELREEITERKKAEEALQESEDRLLRITENMVDCVALVNSSGIYQYVTPSYREVLGYGPEEMVGIAGFSFLHPDDLERVLKLYMDGIEQGLREIRYETRLRHRNGHYVPMEIRARSLKDTKGKIIGGVLAARDITERKQTEEELEKYQKQLEEMVKERTAELENKNITLQELNTTLKVLLKQREDDKKDMEERFVLNVRNLVLPYVERMKKGPLDVAQRPYLEIIETHLNEIATPLLKNMRQFGLTPKEIKVAALVRQGRSTKDIAEILRISTGSIDIHRKHVRKKLGLKNRKANLQSYLENLEQ